MPNAAQTLALEESGDKGLTFAHVTGWPYNNFTIGHKKAIHYLMSRENPSTADDAVQVVKQLNHTKALTLAKLGDKGMTADLLMSLDGFFLAEHKDALCHLMNRNDKPLCAKKAIEEIRHLNFDQAKRIANGETREQVLQEQINALQKDLRNLLISKTADFSLEDKQTAQKGLKTNRCLIESEQQNMQGELNNDVLQHRITPPSQVSQNEGIPKQKDKKETTLSNGPQVPNKTSDLHYGLETLAAAIGAYAGFIKYGTALGAFTIGSLSGLGALTLLEVADYICTHNNSTHDEENPKESTNEKSSTLNREDKSKESCWGWYSIFSGRSEPTAEKSNEEPPLRFVKISTP